MAVTTAVRKAFISALFVSSRQHFVASSTAAFVPSTRVSQSLKTFRRLHMSSTTTTAAVPTEGLVPGRPTWQQTMLRISDPSKSIPFYQDLFGMTLIDKLDFPQYDFTLYFMTTLPQGETYDLTPGTQEAHDYLWSMEGVALELTHNHGTETGEGEKYYPGNQENDGFGHIAVNTDDVYAACEKLEKAGVTFKKKPNEGRMKGLAFAYDPDGYWVEIVSRTAAQDANAKKEEQEEEKKKKILNEYNFSQTMLRVKDPKKSLEFYQKLGMKVLQERHFPEAKFSLYFLGSSNVDESLSYKEQFQPVLELTHNHGTETDSTFQHYNGNEEGKRGFGHIGFLVDDVYKACDAIREMGYGMQKEPDGGSMKGLAFAKDPDGYLVEIIKRGGLDFGDAKVTK